KKNQKVFLKTGAISFCLVFVFISLKTPVFQAEAKFKKAESSKDISASLKNLSSLVSVSSDQSSIISTMKSKSFLKDIVSELGLQVTVREKGLIFRAIGNTRSNIAGQLGQKVQREEGFSFLKVSYEGMNTLKLALHFLEEGEYEVFDRKGLFLAKGKIGALVDLPEVSFVLETVPVNLSKQKRYSMTISPWEETVKKVQKNFSIREEKNDAKVFLLNFSSSSQALSMDFLNFIMREYIALVKKEKNDLLQNHLTFLEGRRKDLEETYSDFLGDHVVYLESSLQREGFMGLKQELQILEKPYEDYHTKLYDVELELNRLRPAVSQKSQVVSLAEDKEKERDLTQKKLALLADKNTKNKILKESSLDLSEKLNASLKGKSEDTANTRSEILAFANASLKDDLRQLAQVKREAESLLESLTQNTDSLDVPAGPFSPSSLVSTWVAQLKAEQQKHLALLGENPAEAKNALEEKRESFKALLVDFLKGIEKKHSALLDKTLVERDDSLEFQGLNPETAQKLYLEYNHELDSVSLNIEQLCYVKDQIFDPSVDVSSLCNLLTDPISQQMVQKAGQMALDLRDDFNRSHKEHERLKDSLSTQKSFLLHHITQMIDVQKMRAKLIEDKIHSLQQSSVHLLNTEKQLIEERLSQLRKSMSSSLPQKWKLENQLQLKKELFIKMIEGIAQLEESKMLDQNILPLSFKVIDPAFIPQKIQVPGLFVYPVLFAFLSMMFGYVYAFFRRVSRGSPISLELLHHYNFHCCGQVSPYADASLSEIKESDLETIRRISHFAHLQKSSCSGLSLGLLGNSPANYSENLAILLSQMGSRVLLIDSTFQGFSSQSVKGLLSFLKGESEAPTIIRQDSYDFVNSGGYCRNFVELLSQKKFDSFIIEKKKEYDFVIIHSGVSSTSIEAMIYQSVSDVCVIAAGFEDSLEDLESFSQWKERKKSDCLTFVLRES
ncbi:MAG: hypothetical protein NTX49_04950, partial [Chlamydiae bacterium]|nr:hypothetical protein [Chlamydiota bacterium]